MEKKVFKTPKLLPKTTKSSTNLNSTCSMSNKHSLSRNKSSVTFNSTICQSGTLSHDITAIPGTTSKKEFLSYDIDLVYNDYLLTMIKKQNVLKISEQHKAIQNGQIDYQTQLVCSKKEQEQILLNDIVEIDEKIQLIELLDSLYLVMNKLELVYNQEDITIHLKTLSNILSKECDKVVIQNINKIYTQEEYDSFLAIIKKILEKTEVMIHSGRNFEKMNVLAEKIRMYLKIRNDIQSKGENLFVYYESSIYDTLQQLSDILAMQCD